MKLRYSLRSFLLAVAIFSAMLGIATWLGEVRESELCLNTFQSRVVYYNEIPYLGIRAAPTRIESVESPISIWMRTNGVVPPNQANAWRMAYLNRYRGFLNYASYGPAGRLRSELNKKGEAGSKYTWVEWSEKNPSMAKVLWPRISTIAHEAGPIYAEYYLRELRVSFGMLDGTIISWDEFRRAMASVESHVTQMEMKLPKPLDPVPLSP